MREPITQSQLTQISKERKFIESIGKVLKEHNDNIINIELDTFISKNETLYKAIVLTRNDDNGKEIKEVRFHFTEDSNVLLNDLSLLLIEGGNNAEYTYYTTLKSRAIA